MPPAESKLHPADAGNRKTGMAAGIGTRTVLRLSLGVCLFVFAGSSGSADAQPVNEPRIVFETREHDFGKQVAGTYLTHVFSFSNNGSAPLMIHDVKAG